VSFSFEIRLRDGLYIKTPASAPEFPLGIKGGARPHDAPATDDPARELTLQSGGEYISQND